jgi:hypothetical protein
MVFTGKAGRIYRVVHNKAGIAEHQKHHNQYLNAGNYFYTRAHSFLSWRNELYNPQ